MKLVASIFLIQVCCLSLAFSEPTDTTEKKIKFESKVKHPIKHFYVATGGELIFAFADVDAFLMQDDNKLRFSLFPHVQQQYQYNFSKHIGFYTGFSIINVGMKNIFNSNTNVEFELKQRSMSFGIPLALKLGNLEKGNYIALGATAEIMFHYKQKLYYNDEKIKRTDWFSDDVNLFNPSVYIDIRNKVGTYIRFKYYLSDFLVGQTQTFNLTNTLSVNYTATQSTLFYISVGHTFMKTKPRRLTLDDV